MLLNQPDHKDVYLCICSFDTFEAVLEGDLSLNKPTGHCIEAVLEGDLSLNKPTGHCIEAVLEGDLSLNKPLVFYSVVCWVLNLVTRY